MDIVLEARAAKGKCCCGSKIQLSKNNTSQLGREGGSSRAIDPSFDSTAYRVSPKKMEAKILSFRKQPNQESSEGLLASLRSPGVSKPILAAYSRVTSEKC